MPERDTSALDRADTPLYTIGQVAELLHARPAALRRLEQQGIVAPERSDGGHRRYSRRDVEQAREAMELADEGIGPAGVRKVLELRRRISDLESELDQRRP